MAARWSMYPPSWWPFGWWPLGDYIASVPSDEFIATAEAENRVVVVDAENRIATIEAESRVVTVPEENRIVVVEIGRPDMILDMEPTKDPDDIEQFGLDWSPLLATGETISTSEWIVDDDDLVVESSAIVGSICTAFFSGGVAGTTYLVTNRITTSVTPRQRDQTIRIRVVSN